MTIKVPKIPKNAAPSRGFSNKSKKPRKKNLIAGSNNSTNSAPNTPSTIRGNEFFSFVIILTIIYKVNIRKKNDISKLFTTFFSFILDSVSLLPTLNHPKDNAFYSYIQIIYMTICHKGYELWIC